MRPQQLDELVQKLESHRRELVTQVQNMGEEQAGHRPSEQEWSAGEQLAHLAAFEKLWLQWVGYY